MKKLFLTLIVLFAAQVTFAQDAFKQDIVKYLNLSGQRKTFELLVKDLSSQIPVEKQADFKKDLNASLDDLMNKMADIYMTEFTHEDIKAVIKFYESPVGKKLTDKSAVLYEKGNAVGQEWGMGLQSMLMKYMQ
ncbi:DUF2059 domain-containing protein [Flavobacterium sp. AG291]|uniref:DUF2059 domain-containing protein n=1 Tax=Flavobacterium sp. AG291 TaxID=2184000 RepID=UPI000E0B268C|nr:DUF2059 domain-containing protein [Flavobacterium sp. AG291]RDI08181.1 hypothetical protein DEU42_1118 [Flavobacterium sp. AG291]